MVLPRSEGIYVPVPSLSWRAEKAVDIKRLLPYYSLVMQPANHAGRLSRPVDVCAGVPYLCVKPVALDSHADLSIAMTRYRADQVHGGTEFFFVSMPCALEALTVITPLFRLSLSKGETTTKVSQSPNKNQTKHHKANKTQKQTAHPKGVKHYAFRNFSMSLSIAPQRNSKYLS